jgi:hypothetical protein
MVNINILNGGNITITTGGSAPAARTATRVWYGDDENVYTDYEIEGSILGPVVGEPTDQIPNVTTIRKIEFGSTVTDVSDTAFMNCNDLTCVIIPDSVNFTWIGESVFDGCSNLTSITIGNYVTTIGMGAFSRCGFTNIVIPNNVEEV